MTAVALSSMLSGTFPLPAHPSPFNLWRLDLEAAGRCFSCAGIRSGLEPIFD